jgi:predicted anti-sigma-YlaC factor YlaD
VLEWLNAYMDGELGSFRLHQVESHLTRCSACRVELAELRKLSSLLQETPAPVKFTPSDRFIANLKLRLLRKSQVLRRRKTVGVSGWLVLADLMLAWFFIQGLLLVNTLVSTAGLVGLMPSGTALLGSAPQHNLLFSAALMFFSDSLGEGSRTVLNLLDGISVFGSNVLTVVLLQVGIGVIYITVLAFWLLHQRKQHALPADA